MRTVTKIVLVVIAVLVGVIPLSCTPQECADLCTKVEEWTKVCKRPALTAGTCTRHFRNTDATGPWCWAKSMEWQPGQELDCSRLPDMFKR